MKTEAVKAGQNYSATVRLELEAAKVQVLKFVNQRVNEELHLVIHDAMEEVLAPEKFAAMVAGFVRQETAKAIENAVREAITYNPEVQDSLRRGVRHMARDVVVDRFGRD